MEALLKKLLGLDKIEAEIESQLEELESPQAEEALVDLVDEIAGQAGGSFGRWLVK